MQIHPLTPDRWADLEELFGPRGAVGGCWCMWWRQSAAEFKREAGEGNRAALRSLVDRGRPTGLLAYRSGRPVGWVSVAPREDFARLQRSRTLGPIDDTPVWSVVCFYIHRKERRGGVSRALLQAAMEHAADQGARVLEAYPVDASVRSASSGDLFTGVLSTFLEAGFREVERRSPARPVVRADLRPRPSEVGVTA